MPAGLRKVVCGESTEEYKFIEECYADKFMDWKAVEEREQGIFSMLRFSTAP